MAAPSDPDLPELRPAAAEDFAALLEVYRQNADFLALAGLMADEALLREDLAHFAALGAETWVIEKDAQTAGLAAWIPAGYEGRPEQAYLELMMIGQPWRSQGLGGWAVQALLQRLRENGCRALFAHVQVNNPRGQAFWLRCGFRVDGGAQTQPDGTVTVRLRLDLD